MLYAIVVARARRFLAGPMRRAIDAFSGLVLVFFGAQLVAERG